MPNRTSKSGSELFIVDNSDVDWKVLRYLHDWCQISEAIDIASGYFEIGALLGLKDEWRKVDQFAFSSAMKSPNAPRRPWFKDWAVSSTPASKPKSNITISSPTFPLL